MTPKTETNVAMTIIKSCDSAQGGDGDHDIYQNAHDIHDNGNAVLKQTKYVMHPFPKTPTETKSPVKTVKFAGRFNMPVSWILPQKKTVNCYRDRTSKHKLKQNSIIIY